MNGLVQILCQKAKDVLVPIVVAGLAAFAVVKAAEISNVSDESKEQKN